VTVRELLDEEARRLETEFRNEPEIRAVLAGMIGSAYRQLALFDERSRSLVRAFDLRRAPGGRRVDQIESTVDLARLRNDQSKFEEATHLFDEALAELDRLERRRGAARAAPAETLRSCATGW